MSREEIQARIARICLLACALPAFLVILGAGIVFDGPPAVAHVLLGAGGMSVLETLLLMMRVAVLGTGPLIKMSLEIRLALLTSGAALLIFDGLALLLLGQPFGGVPVGTGCGAAALTVYLLAIRWFDHYEMFQDPPHESYAAARARRHRDW